MKSENPVAVVLKTTRESGKTIVWKVVATSEMAESYVKDSDEKSLYRYEMWRVSGLRYLAPPNEM